MEPAIEKELGVHRLMKLGLVSGFLSIAAGVLVTLLMLSSFSELFELPGFRWPMLAPLTLGAFTIAVSIWAIFKEQPLKRSLAMFGLGLAGMTTPFIIALVFVALVIALVVAVLAQG